MKMNTAGIPDSVFWYAVSTRSRQEKAATSMLESLAIPTFLPLINETRQWNDRRQMVSVPLFPGYLFVRIPMLREIQVRVLKVPGVVTFIGSQNGPQAIPDAEIEGIRRVSSHRIQCTPCQTPKIGERVRIFRGVLAGIEGTLLRCGSDTSLVISVEMIRQSIAIHVDGSDVEPTFYPPSAVYAGARSALSAEHRI